MSRFTAAGVPVSVLSTPTSFLYGAQASEGVAYIANAGSAVEFVQISDSTGTPGHPVPINPGDYVLLPYGAYNTIKTINGGLVYAQPGFLNKKRFLGLNSGDDIFNQETLDLIDQYTTPPTVARKYLIDMTMGALKAFNLYSRFTHLYIFAAETDQAAKIDWKNIGPDILIANGGTPSFAPDRGYTLCDTFGRFLNGIVNYVLNAYNFSIFQWNLTGTPPVGGSVLGQSNNTNARQDGLAISISQTAMGCTLNIGGTSYAHGNSAAIIASFSSGERLNNTRRLYRNGQLITANSVNDQFYANSNIVSSLELGSTIAGTGGFEYAILGMLNDSGATDQLRMYQVFQAYLSIIGAI